MVVAAVRFSEKRKKEEVVSQKGMKEERPIKYETENVQFCISFLSHENLKWAIYNYQVSTLESRF